MAYFSLAGANAGTLSRKSSGHAERIPSPKKKMSQRARRDLIRKERDLERTIPFSSPAGILLTQKHRITKHEAVELVEEYEECCTAKPRMRIPPRPRFRPYTGPQTEVMKKMKLPRPYYWPKKSRLSTAKEVNFEFLNRSLIERCAPCSVVVEPISSGQIRNEQERLRALREQKEREKASDCVDLCSDSEAESIDIDQSLIKGNFSENVLKGEFSMSCQRATKTSVFMPALQPFDPSTVLATNNFFLPQQPQSSHFTTTSSSHTRYKICTSTPVLIDNGDNESHRGIQQWLQTISAESFTSPVTIINSN